MAISNSDLFFVAAERMTDNADPSTSIGGGGRMGVAILQSGVENNVFPDVMPSQRATGARQVRKVYAAALSADNDMLSTAQVGLLSRPTDANVEMCLFKATESETFAVTDAEVAFTALPVALEEQGLLTNAQSCAFTAGSNVLTGLPDTAGFEVGDRVSTVGPGITLLGPLLWRRVTAKTASTVTVDGAAAAVGTTGSGSLALHLLRNNAARGVSALSLTTASASAGATSLTLDRLDVRVQPVAGATALSVLGLNGGRQPLYFKDDVVLVQHPSTPATREFATILRVNHLTGVVTFTAGLANAYPSGSKVTRPVTLRSLQASTSLPPFSQQTWTRAWSDSVIGASISARYSGAVGLLNKGAANDRWACVFTNSTQFNLISERLGQIGSGNIATNYSPLNPMTNEPFFTLQASAWGSGWLAGNVMRFNTRAAAAPLWLHRCVEVGSGSGTDQATAFIRGDVNA